MPNKALQQTRTSRAAELHVPFNIELPSPVVSALTASARKRT
jgi:hypothetical protein